MTIGEKIDKLTAEYYELYWKLCKSGEYKDPAGMATHDLRMAVYINAEALRELEKRIKG